jgi:hypothetical protein
MSDISTNVVTDAIERQLEADQTDLEVEELGFDPLVLYYCEDFKVAENKITIHQPVIQDFITYGEDNINFSVCI